MAKIRRVDFSPDEWIAGTRELSMAERGAYWDVCSLMYSRGGPIADDDAWIAKALGCHVRTWRTIKVRLIRLGKLSVAEGLLTNGRAFREIKKAENRLKKARDAAEESVNARRERVENAAFPNDYNDIPEASASDFGEAIQQPSTIKNPVPSTNTESVQEAESSSSARNDIDDADVDQAFSLFSEAARDLRIPDPGFLNGGRRRLLAERLAECGVNRWRVAMMNLREAKWLRDDDDPSRPKRWVNFANLLKPENFMGLLEGRYAEHHDSHTNDEYEAENPTVAGIRAAFARRSLPDGG